MAGDIFVSLAFQERQAPPLAFPPRGTRYRHRGGRHHHPGDHGCKPDPLDHRAAPSSGNVIMISPYTGGRRGFGGGGGAEGTNLNITQSQLQDITRVAGANLVIPIYSSSDQITVGSKQGRASVLGLKPDTVQDILVVTEGTFLKGGDGALVGPTLAGDFSLNVGTRIKLGSAPATPRRPSGLSASSRVRGSGAASPPTGRLSSPTNGTPRTTAGRASTSRSISSQATSTRSGPSRTTRRRH